MSKTEKVAVRHDGVYTWVTVTWRGGGVDGRSRKVKHSERVSHPAARMVDESHGEACARAVVKARGKVAQVWAALDEEPLG